jgi:hypothetical protein
MTFNTKTIRRQGLLQEAKFHTLKLARPAANNIFFNSLNRANL